MHILNGRVDLGTSLLGERRRAIVILRAPGGMGRAVIVPEMLGVNVVRGVEVVVVPNPIDVPDDFVRADGQGRRRLCADGHCVQAMVKGNFSAVLESEDFFSIHILDRSLKDVHIGLGESTLPLHGAFARLALAQGRRRGDRLVELLILLASALGGK